MENLNFMFEGKCKLLVRAFKKSSTAEDLDEDVPPLSIKYSATTFLNAFAGMKFIDISVLLFLVLLSVGNETHLEFSSQYSYFLKHDSCSIRLFSRFCKCTASFIPVFFVLKKSF